MLRGILIASVLVAFCFGEANADELLGCYVRNYDAAHLARHPNQLVTGAKLSVRNATTNEVHYKYEFSLQFWMRGRRDPLHTEGYCREEDKNYRCSVECDGGGVDVDPRASHALMYLDRIRMGACGVSPQDPENQGTSMLRLMTGCSSWREQQQLYALEKEDRPADPHPASSMDATGAMRVVGAGGIEISNG